MFMLSKVEKVEVSPANSLGFEDKPIVRLLV